jgi:hypothetical protein
VAKKRKGGSVAAALRRGPVVVPKAQGMMPEAMPAKPQQMPPARGAAGMRKRMGY